LRESRRSFFSRPERIDSSFFFSSFTVLRSLDSGSLPQAFRAYVGLIDYIKLVYRDTDAAKNGNEGVGIVALTSHLVGMANSAWSSLVKVLSKYVRTLHPIPFPSKD
jgi:hypothetical protein